MKTMSKILGLILMIGIAFSFNACGDDEDPYVEETNEFTYTYQIPIKGIANQTQTPEATVLELSSLMGTDASKNFISGDFQRGKCSVSVVGLKGLSETAALKDLKFTIGNRSAISLGNCNTTGSGTNSFLSDYEHMGEKYTDIVKLIFDDLVSKRKSNVAIQFTPNMDIAGENKKVFLNIKVTGLMKYKVYSKK